jgi:hypothetical protein
MLPYLSEPMFPQRGDIQVLMRLPGQGAGLFAAVKTDEMFSKLELAQAGQRMTRPEPVSSDLEGTPTEHLRCLVLAFSTQVPGNVVKAGGDFCMRRSETGFTNPECAMV